MSDNIAVTEGNKLIAERYQVLPNGTILGRKGKPLKLHPNKSGYVNVNTWVKGKQKTYLLHRLVALMYIPNPLNLPEVNHKDGDKLNCHVDNLEWVSRSDNIQHGVTNGLIPPTWKGKSGSKHPRSKPVYQCDGCGYPIKEFESVRQASKETGIYHNLIYDNLKNKLRSAGGFIWKYKK
jgi:hypothetical protein